MTLVRVTFAMAGNCEDTKSVVSQSASELFARPAWRGNGDHRTGRARVFFSEGRSRLKMSRQSENYYNQKNQSECSAGAISPARTIRPGW